MLFEKVIQMQESESDFQKVTCTKVKKIYNKSESDLQMQESESDCSMQK